MHERHSYRLVRDLFDHKEEIFGELKRASTLSHTLSGGSGRPRAISTDESNRRANMEARNRAIVSKSRASSPAPQHAASTTNGRASHRRDRSTGPAETRFPIQTSPTMLADSHKRGVLRQSLEVPGSQDALPAVEKHADNTDGNNKYHHNDLNGPLVHEKSLPSDPTANGTSEHAVPASNTNPDGGDATLGRAIAATPGRFPPRKGTAGSSSMTRHSLKKESLGEMHVRASEDSERPVGVQLTDRPMDD